MTVATTVPVVDRCRGACHAHRPRRSLGGGRLPQHRHVRAPGQPDPYPVIGSRQEVVPLEGAPQAARLDAHDGVHGRVEVLSSTEDAGGDRVLGQPLLSAGEGLLDDEAEEGPGAGRGVEVAVGEDPFELHEDLPGLGTGTALLTRVDRQELSPAGRTHPVLWAPNHKG
jgi:hypothetical protein